MITLVVVVNDESLDLFCTPSAPVGQNPGDGTAESETATPADVSPAESGNPLPPRDDQWRFTIAFPMIWAPDINSKICGEDGAGCL